MVQTYGNNFYTPKELDHSSGRAFLSTGGDIFYSPNCSRQVDVPAPDHRYPFYVKEARFEWFLSPRWWQKPYHYFSFVPLRPRFDGAVFGCLREFIPDVDLLEDDRFALSSRKVGQWVEVEDSLIMVAHLLNDGFLTRVRPGLTPIPPSLLGFRRSFSTLRAARVQIAASRDWFLMWMSLISSKIADIETFHEDWFSFLNRKKFSQDWLSALHSSIVCDFTRHCPRVGTFLNVQTPEAEQPSVEWFYSWGIPVWYRPPCNSELRHLQPPPHILQLATTFISRAPSPYQAPSPFRAPSPSTVPRTSSPSMAVSPTPHTQDNSGHEHERAQRAHVATKPWEAFFAAREVHSRKILANETPNQLQTRLNRERKPPTKSADVFLWEWSTDGSIELVRRRVSKKEREDVLDCHSRLQCKYDAVLNVWDVCNYFGPDDPDDDDDDDRGGSGDISNDFVGPEIDRNTVEAFIDERIGQSSTHQRVLAVAPLSDQGPEVDLTQEANHVDVFRYLSHFYGFVAPLPIPAKDSVPIGHKDWDECLKSVGLQTSTHPPPPGLTGPIVDFIRRLQKDGPREFEWDIFPGNRQPLNRETIAKCFHKLNDGLFVVNGDFLDGKNVTCWRIAVTNSANALYTLRYILQSSEYPTSEALARHLAEKGISFHTLLRLGPFPSSIPLNEFKTRIPRRGANYLFTPADFGSYVAERKHLLATPRGRAAILQGGIVGRLAKEHLEADYSVMSGPSSAVTVHRLGYSVEDDGITYWDDGLSDDELAIICGLYCCYTGIIIFFAVFYSV